MSNQAHRTCEVVLIYQEILFQGFYLYQHFKRTNSLRWGFEVHFLTFSKPFEEGQHRKLKRYFKEFNIYLLQWCMTLVDLFEFCNRKTSKHRSINSRTNHSIFRWFLSLHWLFFGSFMLCLIYFVSFCDTSFRFFIFRFVSFCDTSFRFVSFLHFSFCFVVFRFVSFHFVSFRFSV